MKIKRVLIFLLLIGKSIVALSQEIVAPTELDFKFCYTSAMATQSTPSSASTTGNDNLFFGVTINGVPANSSNSKIIINPTVLPPQIAVDPATGKFTINPTANPNYYSFTYRIYPLVGNGAYSEIICGIEVASPLIALNDTVTFSNLGILLIPNSPSYSVVSNDSNLNCLTGAKTPINLGPTTTVLTVTSPVPGITVNTTNGRIIIASGLSEGSYTLTYQLRDVSSGATVTATVIVNVIAPVPFAPNLPVPPLSAQKAKRARTTHRNGLEIINFPDANLKALLLMDWTCTNVTYDNDIVDTNGDGEIDTTEALNVGLINIAGAYTYYNIKVSDLTGLEYFTNLKGLWIGDNNVTNLNAVNQSQSLLQLLNLGYNPITELNVSNLSNLNWIYTPYTKNSSLDLGNNSLLTGLYCQNNPNLTSINLKNTTLLDYNGVGMQQNCWTGCPLLANICADPNEIVPLQTYLTNCGINTSGISINSFCALSTTAFQAGSGVTVAPNPSGGAFVITFPEPTSAAIVVYNVLGQKVLSVPPSHTTVQNTTIDLTAYPAGVYLLSIQTPEGTVEKTVLKK